jgi:hypothetical protein
LLDVPRSLRLIKDRHLFDRGRAAREGIVAEMMDILNECCCAAIL